ncbi:hypothetical protein GKQ38_05475 [Candidatus Nanohaloarchaea archaeon]|nr:hypothetical protein GKQ38_05475 [Candidatus Nanohaloarchaea archaeon]
MNTPAETEAYSIEVEEPAHIPDLVELTQELGSDNPALVGLDHQEEGHAMRGRYERFGDLEPGEEAFRRPDGGHTVFSDESKYALTFGLPLQPGDTKRADTYTQQLHDFIDDRVEECFQRGARDLYLGGDQLVGVSQKFEEDSAVLRAYWAEEEPDIYDLMYKDGFSAREVEEHREAMEKSSEVLGGQDFYQTVMDEFNAEELTSTEFLENYRSSLTEASDRLAREEGRRDRKACFLER